jgi:hypothetical protein
MKKNLFSVALLLVITFCSNAQVQFLQSVNYRGAFAPAPTQMWTNGWANWDPQNTSYPATTVDVTDSITSNTVWTSNHVYKLKGLIYVTQGATLTIQAGTIIRGDDATANSSLVICKGSKLYAVGTASSPIVFTSNKAVGSRAPGDWGGLILLGRASFNGAGGIANIEGVGATSQNEFGGGATPDDNDNSGTLKYIRIEYGGYVFQPNREINGITFGAVGRGTVVDYIQTSFTNDDSFEWFGGTVNCAHLVAYRGVDDDFDTDGGYSGAVQFCLSVKDPQLGDATWNVSGGSTSEGFECDNDPTGSAATPITKAVFSNVTSIGALRGDASSTNQSAIHPAFRRALRLRRNVQMRIVNSIFMDHPTGLFVDGTAAQANFTTNGTLVFANNLIAGAVSGRTLDAASPTAVRTAFTSGNNDSAVSTIGILTSPYNFTNPDYRPATGSVALTNISFANALVAPFVIRETANSNFIQKVDYRGAFAPSPVAMWTNGWTNWDPQNTSYPSTTVTVSGNITSNTTWTKNNVYLLQGLVYIQNGVTLTIQPGTIIRGDHNTANSSLIASKGGKLIANGTVTEPIVFTSSKAVGSRAPGDWGGIVLLGKASFNGAGGVANIEGIAATAENEYGGGATPDDNDNSGSLKYVRIEYGGYVFQPNREINGLTFGAVGRATTIDYIQCSYINDDAFEWFGGTVNCSHLVSYRNIDDEFDTDNGFSGSVQFCLGVRDPQLGDATWNVSGGSVSEGFESDNDATGSSATPKTKCLFSNVTLIGALRGDASTNNQAAIFGAHRRAARLRRNSEIKIFNSIFIDHPTGLFIDGTAAINNFNSGLLKFNNNLIAGNASGRVLEPNTSSTVRNMFATNRNDSLVSVTGILITPYNYTSPDYRPGISSPALVNYSYNDTAFNGLINIAPCTNPQIGSITGVTCLPSTTNPNTTYTIDSIAGATYTWTIPTGLTFWNTVTNRAITGSTLTGTRSITVRALLTTTAVNGTISVSVSNSCGAASAATISVRKNGAVGKIVSVNGSADPCNGIGSGFSLSYTTAPVSNARGYLWSSIGGTVLSSNDTAASIRFNKISAGSVSVRPYAFCGTDTLWGITKGLVVKTVLPGAVSSITGSVDPCNGIGAGNSLPYSAATSTNSNIYVWSSTNAGISFVTGQGSQNVNVSFPNNIAAGSITVRAARFCGADTFFTGPRSLTVKTAMPVKPAAITSSTLLDPCSKLGSNETYTVASTANTTGYLWSVTGTGASVSSNGTVNGVVDYTTAFRSGSVAVRSQRVCGSSTFSSAPISVTLRVALPTTPVVTGLLTPCRNQTEIYKATSSNTTSYNWTVATGLTLSSSALDSAIVVTGATFTRASLNCTAVRACGSTNINSVTRITGLVRPATGCAPGSRMSSPERFLGTADANAITVGIVYPNPAKTAFTVNIKNNSKATTATLQIINIYGQVVKTYNTVNNAGMVNYTIENASLSNGQYFVRYTIGEEFGNIKLNIVK